MGRRRLTWAVALAPVVYSTKCPNFRGQRKALVVRRVGVAIAELPARSEPDESLGRAAGGELLRADTWTNPLSAEVLISIAAGKLADDISTADPGRGWIPYRHSD